MAAKTMRAVRFHHFGPPDVLLLERVPRPDPEAGEVLVRVHAAGVHPIDAAIRAGALQHGRPVTLPAIPGRDLAGIVVAVGPGVTAFKEGQAVYGVGRGTYADYALAAATNLAVMPRNLTFVEAATVPAGARTAWRGLFHLGELQPGQRLLVQGGADGVGVFAVQFGRWTGAYVIATAAPDHIDFVRALGADEVIDYTATPFAAAVDLVFGPAGGDTLEYTWQVLRPGGILVAAAGFVAEALDQRHGVQVGRVLPPPTLAEILQPITELIEAQVVLPVLQQVFPLEQASEAQALSERGRGWGRIILRIAY